MLCGLASRLPTVVGRQTKQANQKSGFGIKKFHICTSVEFLLFLTLDVPL